MNLRTIQGLLYDDLRQQARQAVAKHNGSIRAAWRAEYSGISLESFRQLYNGEGGEPGTIMAEKMGHERISLYIPNRRAVSRKHND